jgi:predicted permease
MSRLKVFLRALFHRRAVEGELDEELRLHLDRLIEEKVADGMSPQAARLAALKDFGGYEQAKEEVRAGWGTTLIDGLYRDLRHGLRALRRSPAFTAVAVLSLALGVGANAAIYSLVDQVLLRRLPARDAQSLVLLSWNGTFPGRWRWWGRTTDRDLLSHPLYRDLAAENQQRLQVFSELFARKPADVHLAAGGDPESVRAELVSGSYFQALGARPALGRLLDESDDQRPGEHPVAVLSFDHWARRLGSPADIVGRKVVVNGQSMTVVGVAGPGFRGPDPLEAPALWMPAMMQQQAGPEYGAMIGDHRAKWLHVFGRLAPGVSPAQARAALQPWFKTVLEADTRRENLSNLPEVERQRFLASTLEVLPAAQGRSDQRAVLERPLLILLAATGLVLLLACLNVANLFLARAFARRHELAVRAALGASAPRLVRELAVQTGLLAAAGATLGLLIAPVVASALLTFLPETVTLSAAVNPRVFLFALAITLVTGALCVLAPAWLAGRIQPARALKEQSATVSGGVRLRRALVIGQVALALVLLIGAGLFARTLGSLRARASYVAPNLLTFQTDLSKRGYDFTRAKQNVVDLLAATRALPQVESAALSRLRLMSGGGYRMRYTVGPGDPVPTDEVHGFMISPGFFATLGVPFVAGGDFRETSIELAPDADYRFAIVNESFVRRYLQRRNPIGARLGAGIRTGKPPTIEIVGVVKDFPYSGLRSAEVQVFFPALEKELRGATFFVRTRGPAEAAFASIRAAVRRIDPGLPVVGLRTLEAQVDTALVTERFLATLATAFAGLAVLLAVIGLYGVMSFVVVRRTREIGIRLALGSSAARAVGQIVREAAVLVAAGLAIGLPLAFALGRLVESQLFGVRATDGPIMAGAILLLAVAALAGSALPARRASAVNPTEALRAE